MVDALSADVVSGKTFYDALGNPQVGTLMLAGSAETTDVTVGKTFYKDDVLIELTGTLEPSLSGVLYRDKIVEKKIVVPEPINEASLALNAVLLLKKRRLEKKITLRL